MSKLISRVHRAFTDEDDQNLADYLLKNPDGRSGHTLYEILVAQKDRYPWAQRHPSSSWRGRWNKNKSQIEGRMAKSKANQTEIISQPIRKEMVHSRPVVPVVGPMPSKTIRNEMVHSRPVVPVVGLLTSIGDSDLDSSFEEYSVANVVPIVDPIPSKTIRNKMVHSRPVVPVVGLLTSIGDSDLDSSFGEYSVADMVINNGTPEGKGPGCLDGGLGLIDDNVDVQKKQNPLGYVYKGIQMAAVGGSDDQDGTRDDTQGTGAKRGKHDDTDAGNDGDASINNHVGDSSDADTNSDIFIYDNDSQTNQGVNKTTPSCSSPPYSLLSASLPSRLNARDRDLVLERGMDAVVKNLWQKYGVPEWLIWETWGRNIDLTKTEVELQTARRLKYDKVIETD